jgi:uncharacterized protein (TIGR02058 family)
MMALKRIILEMGHGNDMHGGDYTKAALRAVQDCIHHSSLPFLRSLGVDPETMQIEVTVGVQKPEMVDAAKVAASLPHGQVKVNVVKGGLDVIDRERGGASVIATAAVAVRHDLEKHLGIGGN